MRVAEEECGDGGGVAVYDSVKVVRAVLQGVVGAQEHVLG